MCKILTVQAYTGEWETHPDAPEPIEFDEDGAIQERLGLCTCWLEKPEGKELMDAFVEQCIRPMMEKVSWGYIKISVH